MSNDATAPLRAVGPATPRPQSRPDGNGLGWVAVMVVVAVLLEVSVMPYVTVARGIPDLIAPTVVVIALLRGTLVGAVAGFSAGLLVELTAPIGTLGVLALLYLAVGAFCGRYCEREESASLLAPLALSVVAALVVQLGYLLLPAAAGQRHAGLRAGGRGHLPDGRAHRAAQPARAAGGPPACWATRGWSSPT